MKIVKIEKIINNSHLYDIQTKTQNFFANKILVHNSIIKLWHDDEWKISTNGTINAYLTQLYSPCDEFITYGEMFDYCAKKQGLDKNLLHRDCTYIFELISPFNRIVVPYKETKIIHIGTRNNESLLELNVNIGIDKPKTYSFTTLEECLEAAKELPFNEEGYVAVDANWKRNKIKSPAYLAIHHLKDNGIVNNKKILELIMSGEDKEFLSYFDEYNEVFERTRTKYNELLNANTQMAETFSSMKFENRKEMALWIMATCKHPLYSPFFFQLADGKVTDIVSFIMNVKETKSMDKVEEIILGGKQWM